MSTDINAAGITYASLGSSQLDATPSETAFGRTIIEEGVLRVPGDLDEMIAGVKDYLRTITRSRYSRSEPDPLLDDQEVYVINDGDIHGLVAYISNAAKHKNSNGVPDAPIPVSGRQLSNPASQILRTTAPPTTADPATTMSVAVGTTVGEDEKKLRSSTTVTIMSRNSVAETARMGDQWRSGEAGHHRQALVGRDESDLSRRSPEEARHQFLNKQSSPACESGTAGPAVNSNPSMAIDDSTESRPRNSMIVAMHQPAEKETLPAKQWESGLLRLRKKSIQLGQALGSFMNGDYRNADHQPRRESTISRLQTALDRVEPARPKQNAAVFGAFTGAQPITPVDRHNSRRPGPLTHACSEDGRLHDCVQHEHDEM